MNQENGWPAPLPGVLNPIDDPYAAAQQMAVAIASRDSYKAGANVEEAAQKVYDLMQALIGQYLKLREFYDGSVRDE